MTVRSALPSGFNSWSAEATFVADQHGTVDLAAQAPRAGTYAVSDPMGLVWSALLYGDAHARQAFQPSLRPPAMTVTAEVGGSVVARVSVVRQVLTPGVMTSAVNGNGGVWGQLFRPVGAAPVPGVLVLGGSEGGLNDFITREAALLARHGFAALAVAYFNYGTPGSLPSGLVSVPLEYFGKAIAWLQARAGVRSDRIGVIGHSRGGELALLLGATYPQLKAVVSYAGSGIVFGSPTIHGQAAWTYRGKPLPFVGEPGAAPQQTAIPVERTNGPVLLISGTDDLEWASTIYSQYALDRLHATLHPYPDEHYAYPDAGHLIQAPYLPTAQDLDRYGGTVAGMAAANTDAWSRVLRLFDSRLRQDER